MQVQRLTPDGAFPDWLKGLEKRIKSLETRTTGSIVVEPDQTLKTVDPDTGVATIFGNLPDGSTGLKMWVGDTTPPPVPTTPAVSSALGTITMLWNGSFSGTATAPADFSHINAYSQNVTGGAVSLAGSMRSANDSVIFSGVALPGEQWVCWLTSVDANGNESTASIFSAPITVASVLDDSGLNAALANNQSQIDQANANISTNTTAIATKSTISSQSTAPTGAHANDYWLDGSNGNKAMYYNGSAWVSVQDSAIGQALTTANGKNTIVSTSTAPTGTHTVGDTWFDTSNGNRPNTWSGTAWVSVQDASIATAQAAAINAQTSANGKNTIKYSSSAVSGVGTAVGDVWFQTNSNGNVIGQWQWSGSAWVQQVIDNSLIAANIDAGKITAGYIAAARIQAQTITSAMIAANTITAGNILAGTITGNEIKGNTITGGNIAGQTITATNIAAQTITAGQISAQTITTNQIAVGTITASNIAASTITADRIAGGTITATQIAVGTITAANIAASAITSNKISAGAIDGLVITGATIRTAASGARSVMDSTGINAYSSTGANYFSLGSSGLIAEGTFSTSFVDPSNNTLTISMAVIHPNVGNYQTAGLSLDSSARTDGVAPSIFSNDGKVLVLSSGSNGSSRIGSSIDLTDNGTITFDATTVDFSSGGTKAALIDVASINGHIEDAGWTAVALTGGWTTYGGEFSPLEYRRLLSGQVEVRGLIKGTLGADCGALPVGYRPTQTLLFPAVYSQSGAYIVGYLYVRSTGALSIFGGTGAVNYIQINATFYAG